MGYWKVDTVYRGKSDCSVPPENIELRFPTKPIITYHSPAGCGASTYNFSVLSINLSIISGPSAWYHSIGQPVYVTEPDDNDEKHDCINGVCLPASAYDTPGKYTTLAGCQSACGGGSTGCTSPNICVPPDYCPPGMICLPVAKYSTIERLATALEDSACR